MPITATRADLIQQVLENLQKLGNGAPEDEDSAKVDSVIDFVGEQLSARDIYTFDDLGQPGPADGAIEAKAFLDLANIVARHAAPKFGMAGDTAILLLAQQSESNLEVLAAPPRTRQTLQIDAALWPVRRRGLYF